jgi:hypothetical protein
MPKLDINDMHRRARPADDGATPGDASAPGLGNGGAVDGAASASLRPQTNGAHATGSNGGTDHRFELLDNPAMVRLKRRKQWVAFKPDKTPVNPRTGGNALPNKPSTWGSYDQACLRARANDKDGQQLAGIGFMFAAGDNLSGIDLDHVRNHDTGELDPWAAEIVRLAESYAEASLSGTGIHIIVEGKVQYATKSDAASVEIYGLGRYFTMTGQHIDNTPIDIRPAPQTLAVLLARVEAMRPEPPPIDRPPRDPNAPLTAWQELNSAALDDLAKWVPDLWPGKMERTNLGYDISSIDLGRRGYLQERISLMPDGIKDFGVREIDVDPREGSRRPIDLVMIAQRHRADPTHFRDKQDWLIPNETQPYSGKDFIRAAQWLCNRLGREMPQEDDETWRDEINSIPFDPSMFDGDDEWSEAEAADANRDELLDDEIDQNEQEAKSRESDNEQKPDDTTANTNTNEALTVTNKRIFSVMNARHASVSVKGKYRILTWLPDGQYPLQSFAEFSSRADFQNINMHPKIKFDVTEGAKTKTIKMGRGEWFLSLPRHTHFDGIDFSPGAPAIITRKDKRGRSTRYANMFSGFSVDPAAGDCSLYLDHVRDNICGGKELNTYVLDWEASGVQHPDDPGRAALSLRGDPGVGKGIFATEYGALFGRHFFHITSSEHLVGRFNALSAQSVLMFADEAMFAGDRHAAQVLKTLISEKTKVLEFKGIDSFQIPSYSRFILATNDRHPIRIEHKDRRYCSIYVEPAHAKDKSYFLAILDQMKNGGRAALLDFLLKRDISKFNPENIPSTNELDTQKLLSAPIGDRIIISFAQDGYLPGALVDMGGQREDRPWIARARGPGFLFEAMHIRGGRAMQYMDEIALTDILKRWGFARKPLGDQTGWAAPPLDKLRSKLSENYPAIVWDDPALADWGKAPDDDDDTDDIPF